MEDLEGCQIPCLPKISEGGIGFEGISLVLWIKRTLALPWNYYFKNNLKKILKFLNKKNPTSTLSQPVRLAQDTVVPAPKLAAGDWVKIRSEQKIQSTLDRWKELKGCAFLPEMWQYCGTIQQVLQPMERFLDERDYKVKKSKGIILLREVICHGTPVFGRCDRCCYFFWREEWLERVSPEEVKQTGLHNQLVQDMKEKNIE